MRLTRGFSANILRLGRKLRLNLIEPLLINNPLRAAVQRWFEVPQLLRMGGRTEKARVLELGCDTGSGIDLIFFAFGAGEVDAFDLNPMAVRQALRRLVHDARLVRLWAGNVRQIPVADGRYDAVFGFGVLHHVHRWREALDEIRRVLRPDGRFYCEKITKYFITYPLMNRILDHPQQDRFNCAEFAQALEQSGFVVLSTAERFTLYAWFIADKRNEINRQMVEKYHSLLGTMTLSLRPKWKQHSDRNLSRWKMVVLAGFSVAL